MLQECAEGYGADVAKDHYQGATFRERYFKPAHKQSHDQQKSVAMEADRRSLDSVKAVNNDCTDIEQRNCDGKASVHSDRDSMETGRMDSDGVSNCAELDKDNVKMDRDTHEFSPEMHHANASCTTLGSIDKETVKTNSIEMDCKGLHMDTNVLPKFLSNKS